MSRGGSPDYRRRREQMQRRRRMLSLLPTIPDELEPKAKDAIALRNAASVSGRCLACGAEARLLRVGPGLYEQRFEHESWCPALTDDQVAA